MYLDYAQMCFNLECDEVCTVKMRYIDLINMTVKGRTDVITIEMSKQIDYLLSLGQYFFLEDVWIIGFGTVTYCDKFELKLKLLESPRCE